MPFPTVSVKIAQENGDKIEIMSKPYLFQHNRLGLEDGDLDFVDYSIRHRFVNELQYNYSEIIDYIEFYIISVEVEGMDYRTIIILPKPDFPYEDMDALHAIPKVDCSGLCIDGIKIGHNLGPARLELYYLSSLENIGVINFIGSKRPQLSVDRKAITSWPEQLEENLEKLTKKLLVAIIEKAKEHIDKYLLTPDSKEVDLIWRYLFSTINFGNIIFIDELAASQYGEMRWNEFDSILEEVISINEFIKKAEIKIISPNQLGLSIITKNLIYGKLLSASNIKVMDNTIEVIGEDFYKITPFRGRSIIDEHETLICADNWEGEKAEYDIIPNLLPVVPKRLFEAIIEEPKKMVLQKGKVLFRYDNGLTAFFNQDPLLINENLGLFSVDRSLFRKKSKKVYNFERRRYHFHLNEINQFESRYKNKKVNVLFVFIAQRELTIDEEKDLNNLKEKDPNYVKGVREGWSLLFTGMEEHNVIIKPGIYKRDDVVKEIPSSFWVAFREYEYFFLDGNPMKQIQKYNK